MSLQLLSKGLRLRLRRLAAGPVRGITSKPPQDPTTPLENLIGFTTFFLAIMGPSGYIMANLESYKSRE